MNEKRHPSTYLIIEEPLIEKPLEELVIESS